MTMGLGCQLLLSPSLRRETIKQRIGWILWIVFGGVETQWVQVIAHGKFPRVEEKLLPVSFRVWRPLGQACVGALQRMQPMAFHRHIPSTLGSHASASFFAIMLNNQSDPCDHSVGSGQTPSVGTRSRMMFVDKHLIEPWGKAGTAQTRCISQVVLLDASQVGVCSDWSWRSADLFQDSFWLLFNSGFTLHSCHMCVYVTFILFY